MKAGHFDLAGPFLAWSDFHARSCFAHSTIPEEKWGTTRSLAGSRSHRLLQGPSLLHKKRLCSRLAGSILDQSQHAVFFAEIQIRCNFFSSSPRVKPLPLWETGSKKDP